MKAHSGAGVSQEPGMSETRVYQYWFNFMLYYGLIKTDLLSEEHHLRKEWEDWVDSLEGEDKESFEKVNALWEKVPDKFQWLREHQRGRLRYTSLSLPPESKLLHILLYRGCLMGSSQAVFNSIPKTGWKDFEEFKKWLEKWRLTEPEIAKKSGKVLKEFGVGHPEAAGQWTWVHHKHAESYFADPHGTISALNEFIKTRPTPSDLLKAIHGLKYDQVKAPLTSLLVMGDIIMHFPEYLSEPTTKEMEEMLNKVGKRAKLGLERLGCETFY